MALESLLSLFVGDVSDVSDVQASNGAASRCNVREIGDVSDVSGSAIQARKAGLPVVPFGRFETAETSEKSVTFQPKPAPLLGCTAETAETSEKSKAECKAANQCAQQPDRDQRQERSEWRHLQTNVAKRSTLQGNSGAVSSRNVAATSATAETSSSATHHTWLIALPTGERFSSMFCPPLSLAEVQARYPDAQIEREPDPAPSLPLAPDALEVVYAYLRHIGETDLQAGQEFIESVARDPEQLRGLYADVVKMGLADWPDDQATEPDTGIQATAKAVCSRCTHWTPDRINPAGGLGRCAVAAPASKRIGSLWPGDGVIHCTPYQEVTR